MGIMTHHPVVCHCDEALLMLAAERHGDDVALAIAQALEHISGVATNVDAHALAQVFGKLLAQQVVGAHILAVIFVIGLRTVEGEHDYLLAQPNAVSGLRDRSFTINADGATPRGLDEGVFSLLLARCQQRERER